MPRILKQFIYGIVYLFVFGIIIFNFFNPKEKTQKEEIPVFKPIEILGEVERLSLSSGRTVFLAEIRNPNDARGANRTPYKFLVYGRSGNLIEELTGEKNLKPLQRVYVYEPDINSLDKDIYRVQLTLGVPEWVSREELTPEFVVKDAQTDVLQNSIKVRGIIENKSPINARGIRVLAILRNGYNIDLFASETFVEGVRGFEEKAFSVSFPEDKALLANVEPKNTKIFYISE